MKQYKIDIYIVDDHAMLNEGMSAMLNQTNNIHVSRTFTTLESCRNTLKDRLPDVLLLDLSLPDGDGADFCQAIIAQYPTLKILVVTNHDEYSIVKRTLDSGAHGYVLKSSTVETLANAIVKIWHGNKFISPEIIDVIERGKASAVVLTNVERNVLRHICDGNTNPEIAQKLNLSTETINWYRKRLLAKFNVKNTVGLVTAVIKGGVL